MDYVLTTPHMDRLSHIYSFLFSQLGCQFLVPPEISNESRDMGRKLGREGFCQPLNNCIGDIYGALKNGANSVVMTAGDDPCRYGFYWASQKNSLEYHLGYDVEFFLISHVSPESSVKAILKKIGVSCSDRRFKDVWRHTMEKIFFLAELNTIANRVRPREREPGSASKQYSSCVEQILKSETLENTENTYLSSINALTSIDIDVDMQPIKVLLVGAIYEVMEPRANYNIEEYLALLGCEVERSLTYHDLAPILTEDGKRRFVENELMLTHFAQKYMYTPLAMEGFGGYGRMTIGHAARAKAFGFDGIVHVHSFSCMPEIIAKAYIRRISGDTGIPAMSIVVEEIYTEKRIHNRLEAFIDLIKAKRGI